MRYRITVSRSAEKELRLIASAWAEKISTAIDRLATQPRPSGCKKLKGSSNLWRIRIGDYRVVYAIDDKVRVVAIERVAHRKEAYD
jgi:mRNA interferase RelE/StbE